MKVGIFFQTHLYKPQIRFVLLVILLFFTERSLYPAFNAMAYKSEVSSKIYFEEYSMEDDTAFIFPNIPVFLTNRNADTSSLWLYPDYSSLYLWNDDSLLWRSFSKYLFRAMFPRYMNDTTHVAVVEIVGRRINKHRRTNVDGSKYYAMEIMGEGQLNKQQLTSFFLENNDSLQHSYLDSLITMYVQECETEGVNHDVAFVQMCHETGFLRFGGTVAASQNNFCGLGTVNATTPGEQFDTPRQGVRAHIQHLKAYASDDSLEQALVDRRFFYVERGAAPVIRSLTGKWASDPNYDHKLVGLMLRVEKHTGRPLI